MSGTGGSIVETAAAAAKDDDEGKVAEPGNKEAAAAAGTRGMVRAASWVDYVILSKKQQPLLAPKEADEPTTVAMVTKERVPDTFIDILKKRRPLQKLPPSVTDSNLFSKFPNLRDAFLLDSTERNCCVDLHLDVLRQHAEKGFAEVGVDFTDGVKKIFVLPESQAHINYQTYD